MSVQADMLVLMLGSKAVGLLVADAWLEDEAMFDSSDDVSGNDASDSDWEN
jgi:hypothetical protein